MSASLVSNVAVQRLTDLLSQETGQTLSEARRWRIDTLLRPLLKARGLSSLDHLLYAIDHDPQGTLKIEAIDAMLNHESSFFRDLSVFETIENKILPLLAERASEPTLRIWSVGCSTGQEAYSLGMMAKGLPLLRGWRVLIQATDVSAPAIEKAKRGRFSQMDMQRGLPIHQLLRWFEPVDAEWQIADEIREMITFRTDNVLDPKCVTGQFDLILCRNVLFYFPEHHRREACVQIARRANTGAFLVLGAGEILAAETGFAANRDSPGIYALQANRFDCAREPHPLSGSAFAGPYIGLDGA